MKNHKQLIAWQVARDLARACHHWVQGRWSPAHASTFDQLRRSSLSVRLNLVEGYAFGRSPRCRNHFRIAYGSAVETTELLEFLAELGEENPDLIDLSRRVQALTLRLMQTS